MHIVAVNLGRARLFVHKGKTYCSAIGKQPVETPVNVTVTGLEGDQHGNPDVHGGPQLALCLYPHEHYESIGQRLGRSLQIPSFGENLTTVGLLEDQVCIGDTFRIGSAQVQISQPREPCSTLARKHDSPELVRWIHETGFCGFYLRVLQEGALAAGDSMQLVDRPHEGLTVARAMHAMFDDPAPRELLERFGRCEGLSPKWRKRMEKRMEGA